MTYKDKKVVRLSPEIYNVLATKSRTEKRSVNAQAEYLLESVLGPIVVTPAPDTKPKAAGRRPRAKRTAAAANSA